MPGAKILYHAKQEIFGKHLRAKEWIEYSGKLSVYDRKTNPVVLKIKSENVDSFLADIMDDEKEYKGNSVRVAVWVVRNFIALTYSTVECLLIAYTFKYSTFPALPITAC